MSNCNIRCHRRFMAWFLKSMLPQLLFLLLLLVCPVRIAASHPKRPHKLTFYVQETNSSIVTLTTSPQGQFSVLNSVALTEGVLPTSKVIGVEHGFLTQAGFTREAMYASFDFKIDQSDKYKGTFLVQGVFNYSDAVRTLIVVGGTGDFYLAKGHATFEFAAGNGNVTLQADSLKYVAHFRY